MKAQIPIKKKIERLSKEFKAIIRVAGSTDFRAWAYGDQLERKVWGDYILELVVRPKDPAWQGIQRVFILERGSGGSAQVIAVCEEPTEELLKEIKS